MMTYPEVSLPQVMVLLAVVAGLSFSSCVADQVVKVDGKVLPEKVTYNFHVRPLLADRCFKCHGPDEAARKGDLRLDEGDQTYKLVSEGGARILVPGKPNKSLLWRRIADSEPEEQMPPPDSKLTLSPYDQALIKRWIEQGAAFEPHWSFTPIKEYKPPERSLAKDLSPISAFIDSKLAEQGLELAAPADRLTLMRRVTLDLTGLSPTAEELKTYNADTRVNAYELWVDHLLDTDAHAEHLTVSWLDLARYADSQGMHSDGYRSMHPYRDWVIKAFKDNLPFDQFIIEQLAGDLLPKPTQNQLIATGFNRNHPTTAEGGVVDEEFKKEYAHDRVTTTATTFLGLTIECARCHDHKYDPITQKDYYQFFAFFNQVDEVGLTGDDGNSGPNLLLLSAAERRKMDSLVIEERQLLDEIERDLAEVKKQKEFIERLKSRGTTLEIGRQVHLHFEHLASGLVDRQKNAKAAAGVDLVNSERGKVVSFDGEYEFLTLQKIGLFDTYEAFSGSVWINPKSQKTSQTIFGNSGAKGVFWRGWDFILDSLNRPTLRLIHALPHDVVTVSAQQQIPIDEWTHLAFTYDGSSSSRGVRLFLNGEPALVEVKRDQLERSIYPIAFNKEKSDIPLRVGKSYRAFTGEYGIFEGLMDELAIYNRRLSTIEVAQLAGHINKAQRILAGSETDHTKRMGLLLEWWHCVNPPVKNEQLATLRAAKINLNANASEVMVMQDVPQRQPTYILQRGNYDQPDLQVQVSALQAILPFDASLPGNRLGLAQWLVDPSNPLTSRVIVNRYWQHFFGKGLVSSSHDFGLQGQLPSHPELLDYMAFHFVKGGWNLRTLIKSIVMSEVYCQTSKADAQKEDIDPDNILLSRGPSHRLTAEMLRDQALLAAGALVRTVGGPSVKPWQPEGLWKEKTSSTHILREYIPDFGKARYRRSLYTFVRRTSMHPAMQIFDAPTRSVCTSKRQETNSPLQALVLLNDPQFVEAARMLAEKELLAKSSPKEAISRAYLQLCSKEISDEKLELLSTLFDQEKERFRESKMSAIDFISIGQNPPDNDVDPLDLASLALVVNTIMNLDDYYMKR